MLEIVFYGLKLVEQALESAQATAETMSAETATKTMSKSKSAESTEALKTAQAAKTAESTEFSTETTESQATCYTFALPLILWPHFGIQLE